jgi:hypothetical protein
MDPAGYLTADPAIARHRADRPGIRIPEGVKPRHAQGLKFRSGTSRRTVSLHREIVEKARAKAFAREGEFHG